MEFMFVRSAADVLTIRASGRSVLGIEIPASMPELCEAVAPGPDGLGLGNIDPQHGGSAATGRCAAMEAATDARWMGVPSDAVLVTPRVDLDAVAAMAAVQAHSSDLAAWSAYPYDCPPYGGALRKDISDRLRTIDRADSFAVGVWPGQRPLPTVEVPFGVCSDCDGAGFRSYIGMNDERCERCDGTGNGVGAPSEIEDLAAVNWVCGWATPAGGSKITLAQAVDIVTEWLTHGETFGHSDWSEGPDAATALKSGAGGPNEWCQRALYWARKEATAAREAVIRGIQSGTIPMVGVYRTRHEGLRYVPVTESYLGCPVMIFTDALGVDLPTESSAGIAYCRSPVSVIRTRDGRYSIAAFDDRRVNFPALKAEMKTLESGWDGPSRMCSSPFGRPSALAPDVVIAAIERHLV